MTPTKNPVTKSPLNTPFVTAYGEKNSVQLECNDPSRTKQSFQKECDINSIMGKYKKSGLISHVAKFQGNYDVLPSEIDYHESLNAIIAANESFDSLPSGIRTKFANDPGEFLKFVEDEENHDEMVELGLVKRSPPSSNNNNPPEEGGTKGGSTGNQPPAEPPENDSEAK